MPIVHMSDKTSKGSRTLECSHCNSSLRLEIDLAKTPLTMSELNAALNSAAESLGWDVYKPACKRCHEEGPDR